MPKPPAIEWLDLPREPLDLVQAWPPGQPVLILHSGRHDPRWARWSIVARPAGWLTCDPTPRLSVTALGAAAAPVLPDDPLGALDAVLAATRTDAAPADGLDLPFRGGWIGYLSYELGRVIEPAAQVAGGRCREEREGDRWPLLQFAWCPHALVHDRAHGTWHSVGGGVEVPEGGSIKVPDGGSIKVPEGGSIKVPDGGSIKVPDGTAPADGPPTPGPWTSSLSPDAYMDAVTRTLAYIHAGDIFQANVTQRLSAPFAGSTRALARAALAASGAWYGAYLELPGARSIVSMSPELFLEVEPGARRVRSRPIKGTRPRGDDPGDLARSEKDAAELHMIVDLMRNDLGRVCRFGTVDVPVARAIETHGTVHHGVGEVTGTLREDVSVGDLLRASFPAGSITGAPKIRAMQIIETLEPHARGPYCGAVGFISDHGAVGLNVAIRTMLLHGARPGERCDRLVDGALDYGVGGGIVADSEPPAEYRESLDKAAVLADVFGAGGATPFGAAPDRRSSAAACR